ncbi:uncharacterized protein LOC26526354 [Drosophila erecta]|uniref:uncharacterized protein LOC26526354 n=1 Tax=Drosophila erecta TaxID=7220 RepID=UPI000732ADF7|nr:uncharacterized protein LOC26526354 [Drosophila erecta]KQS38561.1 uncharacterized protein Dere_GG26530, isoform A [Drosophila erecta]
MGRLPIVLLIFSSILLIQCQENALDNSAKNVLDRNREKGGDKSVSPPRFQRTCSTQECKEKEFNDLLDSIISSEATTEAEPAKVPHRPSPPHYVRPSRNGHVLHDIVSWVEKTKKAIFGFG